MENEITENKSKEQLKKEADAAEKKAVKEAEKEENKKDRELEKLRAEAYQNQQVHAKMQKQIEELLEEKKKPGITNIREDGKEKKKRPNSWDLSDIMMPPYIQGRVAIYKICNAEEINPATGLKVEPVDVMIPGRYTIIDRWEQDPLKKDKVVKNVVGTEVEIIDGKPVTVEKIDDIVFFRGWIQVPIADKYPLHVVLERHPNNKSNKFRPKNAPVLFERVDIDIRSISALGAATDLALDAGMEVRSMNKEDVMAYCAAVEDLASSAGRSVNEMRTDLKRWAMNNPILYYKLNKNSKAAIQVNILDAMNFGLIDYRVGKGYVDMESDETICVHTPSQEPMDALVRFLANDERGKAWYKQIMERMNYWSND